jgi:hypothetical protein
MKPAELSKWFKERPRWLQDAARRLFQNFSPTADDIAELVILCKREAGIAVSERPELKPLGIPEEAFTLPEPTASLRLNAIQDVKGINALAPRKPLEFLNEALTLIYGSNGAGKSGYIRTLKHICGAHGIRNLHGDIFKPKPEAQSCKVVYTSGGTKKELSWWPGAGINNELRNVCLYDTDCAHVYINEENEVAYEPALMTCFRLLCDACEQVENKLNAEIVAKPSSKPLFPSEYAATKSGSWYAKVDHLTTDLTINERCSWDDALEQDLVASNQRLAEPNPADKAKTLRKTKRHVTDFVSLLGRIEKQIDDKAFETLIAARHDAKTKRQAADVDASKVFRDAPLTGVGSESWRLLWEQARLYSETVAYPANAFPNTEADAKCLLCQQPLSVEAKQRFKNFQSFVKGNLEAAASKAEQHARSLLEVENVPSGADLNSKLDLIGVVDENERLGIVSYCQQLQSRKTSFEKTNTLDDLIPLPKTEVVSRLEGIAANLEAQANAYDLDATKDQKKELKAKANELAAQKWVSQQKQAVIAEVSRRKAIYLLEEAKRLTSTTGLSAKKSELSDDLVTTAFKNRFEKELKGLGATRVRVAISKTKTTKGHVWHRIKLKDYNGPVKTAEVLSEGEFRIVSIAAFLADVDAKKGNTAFIFDDPISSLDQDFEELTAVRLVELSKTRQVIVFTHRLSLLYMLDAAAEAAGVLRRIISLRRESWGAGEPGEPPLPAQNPKKALNALSDQRLSQARKVWENEGGPKYQIEAKALCSDIRITLERLIENDLLADVVQRFRRPINTKGKLPKVAKITSADCTLFDDMMTKYSRYEHSQPDEAPVNLPEPDEIASDLQRLKTWQDEFAKRVVPP